MDYLKRYNTVIDINKEKISLVPDSNCISQEDSFEVHVFLNHECELPAGCETTV